MHFGPIEHNSNLTRELAARGWISAHEPGLVATAGMLPALCHYFDHLLETIAIRRGALPHAYPALVPRKLLERLEYYTSFPGMVTSAGDAHAISPAVCYHTYHVLEGRELDHHPYRISAAGPCARYEGDRLTWSLERLWCFNMRELVFFGSSDEVEKECRVLEKTLQRAFSKGGIETALHEASDPFFGEASRGKLIFQKLERLKVELSVPIDSDSTLAIASINNHKTFFTERMNIRFTDATPSRSGCAAIGLERCAYAFLLRNGLDSVNWPADVRRFMARRNYDATG
jgi:seryl-tRNA synthetase